MIIDWFKVASRLAASAWANTGTRLVVNTCFAGWAEKLGAINTLRRAGITGRKDIVAWLMAKQTQKIRDAFDPDRKNIAFFYPTKAYRDHVSNLPARFEDKGYKVFALFGVTCDDEFEHLPNAFYAGHGIVNRLDEFDLIITNALMRSLPPSPRKLMMLHDIYDSPYGDKEELYRLIPRFDAWFVPSTMLVETLKWQISGAAQWHRDHPDDPEVLSANSRWPKFIINGGYIKLDRCIEYFNANKREEKTLIYAPTVVDEFFEDIVSLPEHGEAIVRALLKNFPSYTIIFRPHPHTVKLSCVRQIITCFENNPRFVFDGNTSYIDNYSRSAVMVSDMSGTAFTYAFMTLRPVVFFSHNEKLALDKNSDVRYFLDRHEIGEISQNTDEMVSKVRNCLQNQQEYEDKIRKFREQGISNIGHAEEYLADSIDKIIEGTAQDSWTKMEENSNSAN